MTKELVKGDILCGGNLLRNQDPATLQDVEKFRFHLSGQRKKFTKKLTDCIAEIRDKLAKLKTEIHNDFTMEQRDANYYRVNMFQLQGKITELKQSITMQLCNLMKEENDLLRDLQFMERRSEDWYKPVAEIPKRPVKSAATAFSAKDDITTFQKFLQASGGHTGGWEEQDHILFLRERRKFKGKPKFISSLHCLLPDISEDVIEEHNEWYKEYENLKKDQKEAIRKWRASRQSSIEKVPESSTEEGSDKRSRPRSYAAQRDITERIKEWKRQQQLKKAEDAERQKEEILRQQEERLRKREIQKAKKSAVNAYKADKFSRMQAEMLSNQMKELQILEQRAKKSVLLQAFREQDQQMIEKRKSQKFRHQLKETQREERLRNVKPSINLTIERDPLRILQATQTWQHHITQQNEAKSTQILSLQTIPHLAVPSWRKGLYTNTF